MNPSNIFNQHGVQNPLYQPQAATPQAKILNDPNVKSLLENFCIQHCPGVDVKEMEARIMDGEKIAEQLKAATDSFGAGNLAQKMENKPEAVKNLLWYLTAKTVDSGRMYTSGSMRLKDPGNKVETFIRECGGNAVYPRGSTHMQEYRLHGEKQSGLDLRSGLPANKRTLLFDRLPDGTLFLKMEERGFPPFWKQGFRNFRNMAEFLGHCGTFMHTRFKKGGIGIKQARKEHVPKNTKKAFAKLLKSIQHNSGKLQEEIKIGQKFGLSRMEKIINDRETAIASTLRFDDEDKAALNDQELINRFRTEHLQALEVAKTIGYTGDVKGNEVFLTL